MLRHVAPDQLSDTGHWPRDHGGYETLLTSRQVSRADYNKEFITKYLSSTHVNVGDYLGRSISESAELLVVVEFPCVREFQMSRS